MNGWSGTRILIVNGSMSSPERYNLFTSRTSRVKRLLTVHRRARIAINSRTTRRGKWYHKKFRISDNPSSTSSKENTHRPRPLWFRRERFSNFFNRFKFTKCVSELLSAYSVRRFLKAPTSTRRSRFPLNLRILSLGMLPSTSTVRKLLLSPKKTTLVLI